MTGPDLILGAQANEHNPSGMIICDYHKPITFLKKYVYLT